MTSGASDLVMVLPFDTVDTVAAKIRESGAQTVQLLIFDSTPAFQHAEGFVQLRRAVAPAGVALMVISSDEQTLAAANQAGIDVVGVEGARVVAEQPGETQPAPRPVAEAEVLDSIDALDPFDEPYGRFDPADDYDDFDLPPVDPTPPRGTTRPAKILPVAPPTPIPSPARRGRTTAPIPARTTRPLTPARSRAPLYADDAYAAPAPRNQFVNVVLPIIVFVIVIVVGLGAWLAMNRPVVYIWPPAESVKTTDFSQQIIPLTTEGDGQDTIQASPMTATAEVTVQGQASQQLSPVGVARGTVQIINAFPSAIDLPEGTQFLATNSAGETVSFLIDSASQVPPAVSTSSIFGTSIQFGSVEVQISARAPGSASNVGAETITQLLIPGQQVINSGDQVRLVNAAIEGGTEEQLSIVGEQDVQNVLATALTQLYQAGIVQLQSQQMPNGYTLDAATIYPLTSEFGNPENYEVVQVVPAVGQPVDPNNPAFSVTVRANFGALAAPGDRPVAKQLETVWGNYLAQQSGGQPCAANELAGFTADRYVWNGQQLAVDGSLSCTPVGALSSDALMQARNAVVNQSRENAIASLESLQQNGVIGAYELPANIDTFPGFAFMIRVEPGAGTGPSSTETPAQTAAPEATAEEAAQ